jgi:hypothetical protein
MHIRRWTRSNAIYHAVYNKLKSSLRMAAEDKAAAEDGTFSIAKKGRGRPQKTPNPKTPKNKMVFVCYLVFEYVCVCVCVRARARQQRLLRTSLSRWRTRSLALLLRSRTHAVSLIRALLFVSSPLHWTSPGARSVTWMRKKTLSVAGMFG